jgi:hypothetical protein
MGMVQLAYTVKMGNTTMHLVTEVTEERSKKIAELRKKDPKLTIAEALKMTK